MCTSVHNTSPRSVPQAFGSDLSFELKQEQKIAVNCLLEGRDVFAVMPTGFGKSFIFQLFSTAIEQKKISQGLHPNSVNLVICSLISLIEDQIKEGQSLGLTCASLQDVKNNKLLVQIPDFAAGQTRGFNKCNTNVLAHRGQNFTTAAIVI